VVVALEDSGVRAALETVGLSARAVVLSRPDELARYAGARPVELVLAPAVLDEHQLEVIGTAQRRVSPHGQLLLVGPDGTALNHEQLDPWRGADAPPPPAGNDLEEIVRTLLGYARVGNLTGLLGVSPALTSVIRTIQRVAPTDVPVLIRGASGTGKELVARGIHRVGPRHGEPFIAVNTPGLSETLIESELFGHERGAFTGAAGRKQGVFEAAGEGTIFLDEIGDLSRDLQSKLLRVLEQGEFLRVGGTEALHVQARVVAATNVELEQAVAAGRFREDLYYRLQVVTIDLPPLRERQEDILPLLHHFIALVCRSHATTFVGFTDEALAWLQRYPWPGNVRELRNLVEQIILLHPGQKITVERLARIVEERSRDRSNLPAPTGRSAEQVERELIFTSLQALREEVAALRLGLQELGGAVPGGVSGGVSPTRSGPHPPGGSADTGDILSGSIAVPLGAPLEEIETILITETLERLGGDKKRTAGVLGIGLRTLYRRLEKLAADSEEEREPEDGFES